MGMPKVQCKKCYWMVSENGLRCVKNPIMRWNAREHRIEFSCWELCKNIAPAKKFECQMFKPKFKGQEK